jgi:hypothetical protein
VKRVLDLAAIRANSACLRDHPWARTTIDALCNEIDRLRVELAWLYNVTAIENVPPERRAAVGAILQAERERLNHLRSELQDARHTLAVVRDAHAHTEAELAEAKAATLTQDELHRVIQWGELLDTRRWGWGHKDCTLMDKLRAAAKARTT